MAASPLKITCDRCGTKPPPSVKGPGDAMAQGWSRFELLDADTMYWLTVCPECLTEAEETGVWPKPSPLSKKGAP